MSQAGSTGKGGGAGAIMTIAGDSGTISGNHVTIYTNNAAVNSGSSIAFVNSGTVSTLNLTDSNGNTILGHAAGNLTTGFADNVGLGQDALQSLTTSSQNVAIGQGSLSGLTGPVGGAGSNTAVGLMAGGALLTGSTNLFLGANSGSNYSGAESNNVLIANPGVNGESRVMRLGLTSGGASIQETFLAGVTGVTVSGSAPIAVNSSGQFSSLGFGTSGQVLTSNGAATSPTWQPAGGFTAVNFSVKISGNIAGVTGDNTQYLIAYDTVTFDSASGFSTGTHLYTIPTTGVYQFNLTYFIYTSSGTSTSTTFLGFLLINGSTNVRLCDAAPGALGLTANGEFMSNATFLYSATAGDTIGMYIQVGGGTKNIGVAGGTESCLFSGFRVA